MKSYFAKGRNIERAQEAERKHPDLQPETEYCLPGSRFALMLRLARAGASDRLMRRKIPGIDGRTIEVARKIVRGETAHIDTEKYQRSKQREMVICRMLDAGAEIAEIERVTGLCKCSVYLYRRRWKAQREAESAAG